MATSTNMMTTTIGSVLHHVLFSFLVLVGLLLSNVAVVQQQVGVGVRVVHGQPQDLPAVPNYCGDKPCIEPTSMSCEEMIETYEFQGSCCSLEIIAATKGCRLTVSFGNCFWYPFCGDCEEADQKGGGRCNNIFETNANIRPCPDGDYNPLEIQSDPTWYPPSCAPSMSPTNSSMGENDDESSASASASTFSITGGMTINGDYYSTTTKKIGMTIAFTALFAFVSTIVLFIV